MKTFPDARAFRQRRAGWLSVLTGPREAGSQPAAGRQARSACLTTGLPGYGQGCWLRVVMLQHQKCAKKGLQILEVCLMVLVRGARELVFEWLWEILAGVAEVFLSEVC